MKRVSFYSALLLCLLAPASAFADAPGKGTSAGPDPVVQKFGGLSMGVGLSLTHDLGWNDRVSKAQVLPNGLVRVDEERNDIARIMLELHYFFTPQINFAANIPPYAWGHGPFIAIEPGKENIINAIGVGWMIGFRNYKHDWTTGKNTYDTTSSWNIGIGFVVENAKILGDGIRANQPLPAGETAIRYKDTSQGGLMLITSFSF